MTKCFKRLPFLLIALLSSAVVLASHQTATAQSDPGWITLLDSSSMGEWDRVGASNWRQEGGAIVADKHLGPGAGFLVSKARFRNFVLHVEFWASDDANSGVFLRCSDPLLITDKNAYEVNIFDRRPDPTYGTGAIVNFVEVQPMPKAGGRWNTYEITANGRQIDVVLNGRKTASLHNNLFAEGAIALQHATGTIKFRKVAIKPLP